jgi:hypothetical protein
VLLRGAALVVEGDNALGQSRHVRGDEADARVKLALCHSTLATMRRGLLQLCAR